MKRLNQNAHLLTISIFVQTHYHFWNTSIFDVWSWIHHSWYKINEQNVYFRRKINWFVIISEIDLYFNIFNNDLDILLQNSISIIVSKLDFDNSFHLAEIISFLYQSVFYHEICFIHVRCDKQNSQFETKQRIYSKILWAHQQLVYCWVWLQK